MQTEWTFNGDQYQVYTPVFITGENGIQASTELCVWYGERGYIRDYAHGVRPIGQRPTEVDINDAFTTFCGECALNRSAIAIVNGTLEVGEQDWSNSVEKAAKHLIALNAKWRQYPNNPIYSNVEKVG